MKTGNYAEALRAFQRDYFTNLLKLKRWRITEAAKEAGADRTYLYRLLKQLGVVRGQ